MAKRCEHCTHWRDSVFKGESASGWGVWWGACGVDGTERHKSGGRRHSLNLACENFEPVPAAAEVPNE